MNADLTAEEREALFRFFHNAGDGGIWEHFDAANSRLVADALASSIAALFAGRVAAVESLLAERERLFAGSIPIHWSQPTEPMIETAAVRAVLAGDSTSGERP